jgi:hypothetical protein
MLQSGSGVVPNAFWIQVAAGLFVAMCVGLWAYFTRRHRKHRNMYGGGKNVVAGSPIKDSNVIVGDHNTQIVNPAPVDISRDTMPEYSGPTTIEIGKYIDNFTPYEIGMRVPATRYDHHPIVWGCKFSFAYPSDNREIDGCDTEVRLVTEGNYPLHIDARVRIEAYPIFKSIHQGRRVRVSGKIKKLNPNGGAIELEDAKFWFPD